jgi:hypothetical protein
LNLQGKPCTLHAFSTDGITLPRKIDFKVVARAFHTALEEELERAGLGVKFVGPDDPNEGIVITGRFVKVRAGSRLMRYFAPFLSGAAAIVEVEGTVANEGITLDNVEGTGRRGLGPLGGASPAMLESAAEVAGLQLAHRTLEILLG